MRRLQSFFNGRYGIDQLGIALGFLSCVLTFFLSFTRNPFVRLIGLIPFIFIFWRAFSTNFEKRTKENEKFLKVFIPLKNYVIKKQRQHSDKEHKYYDCPSCKHTLRVPSHKGKIEICCPYCNNKFKKNTGKVNNNIN